MFFVYLNAILQSPYLLFLIEILSCLVKIYLLIFLITTSVKATKIQYQLLLLLIVLSSGLIVDISWIVTLFHKIKLFPLDFRFTLFIVRCAWAINFILFLT